jgi:hypothetical protein
MRSSRIKSISPELAWDAVQRGEVDVLDLWTELERRRDGYPRGAARVWLVRHVIRPRGREAIYLSASTQIAQT